MAEPQQSQFDGENAVSGYTLFHGKDGKSYYLKGEGLADDDITQRVQKLRGAKPAGAGDDVADLQRRTLQQARGEATKPLTNAVAGQRFVDSLPPMTGTFPTKPDGSYDFAATPAGATVSGSKQIAKGNVAKGAHQIIGAVGEAATPALPILGALAPIPTLAGVAGSAVGGFLGKNIAPIFGANPDQADLAGDIGSIAGGTLGARVPSLRSAASSVLRTPEGPFKPPVQSAIDAIKHPTEIPGKLFGAALEKAVPQPPQYPGAALPAAEDFYSARGTDLMRRGVQEDVLARRAAATAKANAPQPELGSPENPGFYAKLPTRMPKPPASAAPPRPDPFAGATASNAALPNVPLPSAGAYAPPVAASVPGVTADAYSPPSGIRGSVAKPSGRLILSPEEARAESVMQGIAKTRASQHGTLYAAGMRPAGGGRVPVSATPTETFEYPGARSAYDPPDAQYSPTGGAEGPYSPPNYAYRVHDANVGPENFDLERSHAHATMSPEEATAYQASRNPGTPQAISKNDLSGLKEGVDYKLVDGPNGGKWVRYLTKRAQSEFEPSE